MGPQADEGVLVDVKVGPISCPGKTKGVKSQSWVKTVKLIFNSDVLL